MLQDTRSKKNKQSEIPQLSNNFTVFLLYCIFIFILLLINNQVIINSFP